MEKMWDVTDKHRMTAYRSTLTKVRLITLVCQLVLFLRTEAQIPEVCAVSDTNRPPENSDISVSCGTQGIDLNIYLCPVYQAQYNESLMMLNNQFTKPACGGAADFASVPPILKFKIPLNESAIIACGNSFKTITDVGSGLFSDFSNIQSVNISGIITSRDPTAGAITYRTQLLYKFSCYYPLQYLLNNTQLGVSGVSVAIKDNNGTFISTLSMHLYKDALYQEPLTIPSTGISLKTKIYVSVKATNLTEKFNVLLDRCYATTSPYPGFFTYYDLFVGCNRDPQTKVDLNGLSQKAQFSFEAFRFMEHKNLTVSTFYLHCATRLCEVATCQTLFPNCTSPIRVRREAQDVGLPNATVTSTFISVSSQANGSQSVPPSNAAISENGYSSPVVAVIICIIILTVVIIAMAIYLGFYMRQRKPQQ